MRVQWVLVLSCAAWFGGCEPEPQPENPQVDLEALSQHLARDPVFQRGVADRLVANHASALRAPAPLGPEPSAAPGAAPAPEGAAREPAQEVQEAQELRRGLPQRLEIFTQPSRAAVYQQDRLLGLTPLVLISPRPELLVIQKPGHRVVHIDPTQAPDRHRAVARVQLTPTEVKAPLAVSWR